MFPWTSKSKGFRRFDGNSFGELVLTKWDFDGTEEDVTEFASNMLCDSLAEVDSVKDIGNGTFDVLLTDGSDYRVYTDG